MAAEVVEEPSPGPRVAYATVDAFAGWRGARAFLEAIIAKRGCRRILEIGAGARPALPPDFGAREGLEYTVADASPEELAKAEGPYRTVVLDAVEGPLPEELLGRFDLVFSRMVCEHVSDPRRFHESVRRLLRPSGLAVHFFSTLYALPFLANRLLPGALSRALLERLAPRDPHHRGKFAARYRWCRGPTRAMRRKLEAIGYEVEEHVGYFGHRYYRRASRLLDALERHKSALLARAGIPWLTSYAHVVLRRVETAEG